MPTNVYVHNGLVSEVPASTSITPPLGSSFWSGSSDGIHLTGAVRTPLYWIDREEGIVDGATWVVTSTIRIGGSSVQLLVQLVGTLLSSDIAVQIAFEGKCTGWSTSDTQLRIVAADGLIYRVTASFISTTFGIFDDVVFAVCELKDAILPQIDHVVVLMMENRSLDNLLGWIYPSGSGPAQVLPAGSPPEYNGLDLSLSNSDPSVNDGEPVHVRDHACDWKVPSLDPGEEFDHVTTQLCAKMQGFLTDYISVTEAAGNPAGDALQIMETYSVEQLPIITTLATKFAVSDRWFASVPSQTWPNRGFAQTGSSDGNPNNTDTPWNLTTVFDVFSQNNLPWMVYNDGLLPSLTKVMYLYSYLDNDTNFAGIDVFTMACAQPATAPANVKLPAFSFVEPNFGIKGHDQSYHPPHDVCPGEHYLRQIYGLIQDSPYRDNILFVVLFDEHGGTYDHVPPDVGAQPPAPGAVASNGFPFNRFGVRIPAIVVSSWVTPGTVFRSDTSTPLDHTSLLATLRDWQGLSGAFDRSLPSPRIKAAPNLAYVLTETTAQPWPTLPPAPCDPNEIPEPDDSEPLNSVQQSVLIGAAAIDAGRPFTAPEAQVRRARLQTHGDGRRFMDSLGPKLPMR